MAAGVSLDRAIESVGHARGTSTRDIVRGLRALGVPCYHRLRRVSLNRPVFPKRAVLAIRDGRGRNEWHWILHWDGQIYDPAGAWPERYERDRWKITSYLEIER
jgi:hypothetical protein